MAYEQISDTVLTATETTGTIIKGRQGYWQFLVTTYTADINLQARRPASKNVEATGWVNTGVLFDAVGSLEVSLCRGFEYRLSTATAGSVIDIDRAHERVLLNSP